MRKAGLLIACALAVPTALAEPETHSDLAECKLDWAQAQAAMAGLRVLSREDLSDPDDYEASYEVDTKYDASTLHPAGLSVTAFKHEDFGGSNYLVATLGADYAKVRDKMLAAHGRTACYSELVSPKSHLHLCQLVRGLKSDPKPGIWVDEKKKGKIEIQCAYSTR